MSQETPQDPSEPQAPKSEKGTRRGHFIWASLYLVVVILVSIYEGRETVENLRDGDLALARAISTVSIDSLSGAFLDRLEACDYRYLVVCVPRQSNACDLFCPNDGGGVFSAAWTGLRLQPRLPDVIWYVLSTRFKSGDVASFILTLIFVVINIFIWLGALTSGEGGLFQRTFIFLASIPMGPLVVSLVFWIGQQFLLLLTSAIGIALQILIVAAGIPAMIIAALSALHTGVSLREAFKGFYEALKQPFS
jgi:hypothetical protein